MPYCQKIVAIGTPMATRAHKRQRRAAADEHPPRRLGGRAAAGQPVSPNGGQRETDKAQETQTVSLHTAATTPLAPRSRAEPDLLAELFQHGFSESEISSLVIPKRTLARRRANHEPLTVEETDKALRLGRIVLQAERVFADAEKAHRWLRKAKRELEGETPLAFLASESGARLVEEMLHRIEHGIFA